MVRAILEGQKTQTRRIVKIRKTDYSVTMDDYLSSGKKLGNHKEIYLGNSPYGQPGDRLWVKETWATAPNFDHLKPTELPTGICILKRADNGASGGKWRPSIFMMQWMSRITLEITNVRVEQLKDISEDDACAEGVDVSEYIECISPPYMVPCECATRAYSALWEEINGPGSWDANPWVWVIEFKRVHP